MPSPEKPPVHAPAFQWPLYGLCQVHLITGWRRLKGLGEQSKLLSSIILLFISGYLVLAFGLFYIGFRFIWRFPGLGGALMDRLLFLLFAFLFLLLLLSNLVISYTNLFRSRETHFLLGLPLPTRTIFQWKFIESTILASWAFVFLIAPLLAAYGMVRGVPWHFYPVTTLLVGLFIVLPSVVGCWLAVTVARYLDRRLFQILMLSVLVSAGVAIILWLGPTPANGESTDSRVWVVLDKMLFRTGFAESALLPSYWLSRTVLHWSEGAVPAALFFMLVLLSYALFFGWLCLMGMGPVFYDAASVVQSRGDVLGRWAWFRRRRLRHRSTLAVGLLERFVHCLPFIPSEQRALLVKDTRMFWRDTTQWAQSLVLFGLLGVYVFNLRHFSQQLTNPFWIHLVSFLNLGACSLNLATLTTRFVYPQFSLEGKRMWIIGLAPIGMVQVVKIKFWLAAVTALLITLSLIWLSCYMLALGTVRTLFFTVSAAIMTLTLTGLAVGLGTLYPNFKEENPSKIVSGFGGTFCLVLSFVYIVGSVVVLALGSPWQGNPPNTHQVLLHTAAFLLLSGVLGCVPLCLGLRRVLKYEL